MQEWVHKQITVHLVPGGDAFHGDVHVRADMQHVLSDLVNSPEVRCCSGILACLQSNDQSCVHLMTGFWHG